MNKRTIFIVLLSLSLLTVGGVFYWNYTTSPKYSLGQMGESFSEHDLTTFQKYVDTEGVINNLFDQQMDLITADKKEGAGFAEDLTKGIVTLMRPQVIELLKRQINKLVEAGSLDKSDSAVKKTEPFTLAEVWNKSGSKNNISGIREIMKDGKIATVTLEINQDRFDTTLLFNIKMRDKGTYWQLSELTDFKNFALTLENLEKIRVDKINRPIYDEINKALKISDVQMKRIPSYLGLNDKIKVSMQVTNIGDQTIWEYLYLVGFENDTGKKSSKKTEVRHSEGLLRPNESEIWTWTTGDDFYESAKEELSFNIETEFVKFEDGTVLRLIKKWGK